MPITGRNTVQQKRDLDLIRMLLLELEGIEEVDLAQYTEHEIKYHKYLLYDAGFAEGTIVKDDVRRFEIIDAELFYLNWQGHEFLANARNDTVWNDVKQVLRERGLSVSFSILQTLLSAAVTSRLS